MFRLRKHKASQAPGFFDGERRAQGPLTKSTPLSRLDEVID